MSRLLLGNGNQLKTSPDPTFFSGHMALLSRHLFAVCPNGVISSKKLRQSIAALARDKQKRLNYTKHCDTDFIDMVDQQIRISSSQYRELKASGSKYATSMRKASTTEKEIIDLEKGQGEEVAPGVAGDPKPADATDAPEPASTDESIFKKILSTKVSDATTPKKTKGIASTSSCSKAVGGAAATSSKGLSQLGMSADELDELRQWMLQKTISPVKRNKKKGQAKAKAKAKSAGKGKAKAKAKPKPKTACGLKATFKTLSTERQALPMLRQIEMP